MQKDTMLLPHTAGDREALYMCKCIFTQVRKTKWVKDLVKPQVALHLPLSQWWLRLGKLEPRNLVACLLWLLKCWTVGEHFGMGGCKCHLKSQWCDSLERQGRGGCLLRWV